MPWRPGKLEHASTHEGGRQTTHNQLKRMCSGIKPSKEHFTHTHKKQQSTLLFSFTASFSACFCALFSCLGFETRACPALWRSCGLGAGLPSKLSTLPLLVPVPGRPSLWPALTSSAHHHLHHHHPPAAASPADELVGEYRSWLRKIHWKVTPLGFSIIGKT